MPNRFNLLGQVAITAAADFGLANLISTTAQMTRGYHPSAGKTLGMVALILASHVVVNAFGIRHIRYTIYIAMVMNSLSIGALGIAVLSGAKTHNSAQFVFAKFFDGTAADRNAVGWSVRASPTYVAICGTLFSQYTLLGFDASAHLCEETKQAVGVAPWCLLSAVGASFVCGFLLLLSLLFSIQDFDKVRTSPIPILQIFTDSCGEAGGLVLITIVMLCVWHCGLFSMVSIPPSLHQHLEPTVLQPIP
jgi:amino acid transporter